MASITSLQWRSHVWWFGYSSTVDLNCFSLLWNVSNFFNEITAAGSDSKCTQFECWFFFIKFPIIIFRKSNKSPLVYAFNKPFMFCNIFLSRSLNILAWKNGFWVILISCYTFFKLWKDIFCIFCTFETFIRVLKSSYKDPVFDFCL